MRDLEPALAAGGRHLRADEAGADHDHPAGLRIELAAQREAVVEGAQGVDPGHAVGDGHGARRRAGGDDEAVEVDLPAVVEGDPASGEVERRRPRAEAPVEVELVARRGQLDAVGVPRPRQHLLRERRPVVGRVRLLTDDHDAAVVPLFPQRLGRPAPGQARSDDDDGLHGLVGGSPSVLDRDGLLRAAADRLLHLRAALLRWVLVEHVEEVVVPDLEHLRRDVHAHRVALTQVEVHDDPHAHSPSLARSEAGTP